MSSLLAAVSVENHTDHKDKDDGRSGSQGDRKGFVIARGNLV